MKRSEFGLWAATSLALTALPMGVVLADSDDKYTNDGSTDPDGKHHGAKSSGKVHKEPPLPPTATSLTHNYTVNFQSDEVAEDKWAEKWPQGVSIAFLIDYKGNYLFTGTIPPQPKMLHDNATVYGVALKAASLDNQIIAFLKKVKVTTAGGSWSHQGHDQIIGDLWKGVAGGHSWHHAGHSTELVPKPKPVDHPKTDGSKSQNSGAGSQNGGGASQSGGGGGGGGFFDDLGNALSSGASDVVSDLGSALGGAVSSLFSFL